ncbi:MAG: DNA polymerase III subunit gamma/tau [bacterium]|nr:DNA polymerase III subunit gamma/tau [bacterium]
MYYLTYRPKTIQELDNSHVRETIANLLQSKNLPHALLFVGPKGTGKTSTARIVAKAINCLDNAYLEKGTSYDPCNKCSNCTTITSGGSPDVVEQDAASNRGIDEIRRLIRESSFAPMTGTYRVYIIDEAHMITPDAFNALLKTLEEPPKSVIFILATTNEEKLPTTIISRCLRVPFGAAKKIDIIHMLKRIAESEQITIKPDLYDLIATYSENSFRDATKLLEELVVQKKLDFKEAQVYLGIRSKDSLLHIIADKDLKEAMDWIDEFVASGGNVKHSIEDMLQKLRVYLVKKATKAEDGVDINLSMKEITQLIKLLHEAYNLMKISPIEVLPLEIAVVEFYNKKHV